MNYNELSDGITHIEDLPTTEFIEVLGTLDQYEITEKVDGAQLLFGIDSIGFYTSRESKGGSRHYSVDDYGTKFSETYMRTAHLVLESALPLMQQVGLCIGCQLEVEVLYGEIPNVVRYSADVNHIIFLRTTCGTLDINCLSNALSGSEVTVTTDVPRTLDGRHIIFHTETSNWKFARSAKISVDTARLSAITIGEIAGMTCYLTELSDICDLPNSVIETISLNKTPDWCESMQWKLIKPALQVSRARIQSRLQHEYKSVIKSKLLDAIVKGRSSQFGPPAHTGGWIEGVVLKHCTSGRTIKLVDKSVFLEIKDACWQVRNQITAPAKSVVSANSIMARMLVSMSEAIGHPLLGTLQSKNYLKKIGKSTQSRINMLTERVDATAVNTRWANILQNSLSTLSEKLDEYEKETKGALSSTLQPSGGSVVYSPAVIRRTKETFAESFTQIEDWYNFLEKNDSTADQLVCMIAGKKLKELHIVT